MGGVPQIDDIETPDEDIDVAAIVDALLDRRGGNRISIPSPRGRDYEELLTIWRVRITEGVEHIDEKIDLMREDIRAQRGWVQPVVQSMASGIGNAAQAIVKDTSKMLITAAFFLSVLAMLLGIGFGWSGLGLDVNVGEVGER